MASTYWERTPKGVLSGSFEGAFYSLAMGVFRGGGSFAFFSRGAMAMTATAVQALCSPFFQGLFEKEEIVRFFCETLLPIALTLEIFSSFATFAEIGLKTTNVFVCVVFALWKNYNAKETASCRGISRKSAFVFFF